MATGRRFIATMAAFGGDEADIDIQGRNVR
jgi:hypothetical protein